MDSQIAAGDQAIKEGIPEKISSAWWVAAIQTY